MLKDVLCGGSLRTDRICVHEMLSVHLISGAASVPPLSLALFYKGKRLPNRAIYATSVVYHVNCRLSTVSKICIQLVYKKFAIWRSFPLPAWLSALSPAPRSCLAGTPPSPSGYLPRRFSPCRFRLRRGDARGEAPCIRKLKISPFPLGRALCERGQGDGGRGVYPSPSVKGAEKQAKGRVGRRPRGQAPPLRGTTAAGTVGAVSGLVPGRRGRSPRQN